MSVKVFIKVINFVFYIVHAEILQSISNELYKNEPIHIHVRQVLTLYFN